MVGVLASPGRFKEAPNHTGPPRGGWAPAGPGSMLREGPPPHTFMEEVTR